MVGKEVKIISGAQKGEVGVVVSESPDSYTVISKGRTFTVDKSGVEYTHYYLKEDK